jgi:hypothetical protein
MEREEMKKAEEMQKLEARTAKRGVLRSTAATQQKFPSTSQREFSFTPKQAFSSDPDQAFSYDFTTPTEMDTGIFTETESDLTSIPPHRDFTSTSPCQSKFTFGSLPSQSNFEIPVAWEQNTDVPQPVPIIPIQGQHQR